jgi:hypothetical protein
MSVIQRDNLGIVPTVFHFDEHTGELHVERRQDDVEPLLDAVKRAQAQHWDGFNADRSLQLIAEIPVTVAEQWAKEGVDIYNPDHNAECMKRLNDPALRGFRFDKGANVGSGIIIKGER